MKHLFLATCLLLAVASCKSGGSDPVPAVQTASLTGQVQPASAVTAVTATDSKQHTYTATLTSAGNYSFAALPLGAYTLTVATTPSYAAPSPAPTATVAAGGTTMPLLTLQRSSAAVTYKVDGVPAKAIYLMVYRSVTDFRFDFRASGSASISLQTLTIAFNGMPAVGTFPVGKYSVPASLTRCDYTSPEAYRYSTNTRSGDPTVGSVTITELDMQTHLVSGTFAFAASPTELARQNEKDIAITDGVFTNIHFY